MRRNQVTAENAGHQARRRVEEVIAGGGTASAVGLHLGRLTCLRSVP
jgi:hypothetical protein